MRFTPKRYAEALFTEIEGKSKEEAEVIIKKFVEVMSNNHNLSMEDRVLEQFKRVWNDNLGVIEAQITTAHKLGSEQRKDIEEYILKESGAKELVIKETVDSAIIGGMVIKFRDKILDGSVKTRLLEMREKMVRGS